MNMIPTASYSEVVRLCAINRKKSPLMKNNDDLKHAIEQTPPVSIIPALPYICLYLKSACGKGNVNKSRDILPIIDVLLRKLNVITPYMN